MKYQSKNYTSGEKALTRKEYEKLLSVIDTHEDELFLKMAITTGLRREDLANIKIGDVDLNEKLLYFHESKKNVNRSIPLMNDIVILLSRYLKTTSGKYKDNLFSCTGTQMYRKFNGNENKKKTHHIGYFDNLRTLAPYNHHKQGIFLGFFSYQCLQKASHKANTLRAATKAYSISKMKFVSFISSSPFSTQNHTLLNNNLYLVL